MTKKKMLKKTKQKKQLKTKVKTKKTVSTKKQPKTKQLITSKMVIGEIAEKYPLAVEIMFNYGLHCIGCHISPFETLEQGALAHGLSKEEINKMVREMNEKVKNQQ